MNGRLRAGAGIAGVLVITGCLGSSQVPPDTGAGGTGQPDPTGTAGTAPASGVGGTSVTTGIGGSAVAGTGGGVGGTVGGSGGTSAGGRGAGPAGTVGSSCTAGSSGSAGTVGTTGRGLLFPPNPGAMVSLASAPPAISGGTLRVLADGLTAVAADPDRDRVYVVDLGTRTLSTTVPLSAGDEPGRVIEDAAGLVHVALRRGGAIATFDPRQPQPTVSRTKVCTSPRGLAYQADADLVHVACADGELVSVSATTRQTVRTLQLERDLRDVVVDGSRLRVSRFRSAELLTVEADGTLSPKISLPAFSAPSARSGAMFTAGAAWQMVAMSGGGVAMLHQRGVVEPIRPTTGGYGNFNPCGSIVHAAVSAVAPDGTVKTGPALPGLVLAVDMAYSPDGSKVAFISLGNATNTTMGSTQPPQLTRLFVTDASVATDETIGCKPDGTHGPCLAPSTTLLDTSNGTTTAMNGCPADPKVYGQPIAVTFAGDGGVVVQSREPAMLALADGTSITLSTESRNDTGQLLFHANAGGFVACASCHVEGDDDGRVWSFGDCTSVSPRRTQSLQTGLRGTEPFHWNGDEANFGQLMNDVFVTRMSGPKLTDVMTDALVSWVDAQPRPLRRAPADAAAVQRGAALFNDTQNVGCVTCHAGARFSNNASMDVGTGRAFQVPSLLGIGTRGPFMHDGCAATLRDRFNPACGGANHGVTASLSSGQIDDLIAFLQSL